MVLNNLVRVWILFLVRLEVEADFVVLVDGPNPNLSHQGFCVLVLSPHFDLRSPGKELELEPAGPGQIGSLDDLVLAGVALIKEGLAKVVVLEGLLGQ